MISNQSLACAKGTSFTFEIDMETGSDLTGATAQWALAESWFDGAQIFLTKTTENGVLINQESGTWKIIVELAPNETLDVPSGLLYHDCKVLLQNGDVEDVANGPFLLDPSVNVFGTNAVSTRNIGGTQILGSIGQGATGDLGALPRHLQAAQSLGSLGQTATASSIATFQTDFTAISSLPPEVSLSRTTSGTYFDAAGVLQTAAIDAPRFDYDPYSLLQRGLLVEPARINFCLQSNNFSASPWSTNVVSLAQNAVGPDGVNNSAWTFTATGTAASEVFQPVSLAAGSVYTVYAKAGTATWAFLQTNFSDGNLKSYFDLTNIIVGLQGQGSVGTGVQVASIDPVGDGWNRICVKNTGDATSYIAFGPCNPNDASITVGQTALFYGADAELGSFPTSYILTTTGAAARTADVPSANSPLTGYLSVGPAVLKYHDEVTVTGTTARSSYAAGAFNWPTAEWYRLLAVYIAGTDTSSLLLVPNPAVAAWGDSLTYSSGASNQATTSYPADLATAAARTILNGGVQGDTSTQVATRMLADTTHTDNIGVFWVGRNDIDGNPANTSAIQATILGNIASMVAHLDSTNRRFVVMSILNSSFEYPGNSGPGMDGTPGWPAGDAIYTQIGTINAAIAAAYPSNYLDIRSALQTYKGSLTFSSIRSDFIHLNDEGYFFVASRVQLFLRRNDW